MVMAVKPAFDAGLAREVIERRRSTPGAALPILHDLQHEFGYVDDEAVALMAEALNISKAEALGVASFYHDFRRAPVEGRVLKLCRAESCQAMGCENLVAHLEARHGLEVDEARACRSRRFIASAIARFRPPRCSTASRSAGSTPIGSMPSSRPPRDKRNE